MATITKEQATAIFRSKTDKLTEIASDRVDDIVHSFGLDLRESGGKFTGCCPIHGGDNQTAFHIYKETGNWKCFTHQCHSVNKYGYNIIGFVKGMRKNGFMDAVYYLCNLLKIDWNDIKVDVTDRDLRSFNKQFCKSRGKPARKISRHYLRKSLIIPAEYYIKRGYSAKILNEYDVGLCTRPGSFMENRVIIPVWQDNQLLAGLVARTIFEDYKERKIPKWLSETSFNRFSTLFNYYKAKEHIKDTGSLILVEGPGDIFRLEEAGIKNAVAMFGTELTSAQQQILEESGAINLIVFTDNDDAGKVSLDSIREKCKHSFNIISPKISKKDAGEMTVEEIRKDIIPILDKVRI